ncbi:hypothetical protein ABER98_07125, partial [Domibacillus aminovorans]|uniref:hypothetical protein n=1 Tax=Domibacillus aminovorans TaxID=29332 RepID=UPI003D1F531B
EKLAFFVCFLELTHPLAIHVAQNQRYTTDDENVCRTGIGYYGWERKVDQLWCHRAHPLV